MDIQKYTDKSPPQSPQYSSLSDDPLRIHPALQQFVLRKGSCQYQNPPQYSTDYCTGVLHWGEALILNF